jgi:pimeloyl-ACP methyl ester carboxylesterase
MSSEFTVPPAGDDGFLAGILAEPGVQGVRTAVLFLHGFGSSQEGEKAEYFRARVLESGRAFVSFDFQGHGRSGGTMGELTLSRCLRDVERVRRHLSGRVAEQVVLLGSSMGGLVGLWHTVQTSRKVRAGLFIAPALGLDRNFAVLLGREGMLRWEMDGVLGITNELGTFELGWGFVEDFRNYPVGRLTAGYKTPAILFQGKLDDRVPWDKVAEFAESTSAFTRLELFDDGDHRLLAYRDSIWEQMLSFLDQQGLG